MDNEFKVILMDKPSLNGFYQKYKPYIFYEKLKQGLESKRIQELINKKSWMGEICPILPMNIERQTTINILSVSHRINSYEWTDDKKLIGNIFVYETRYGKRLKMYLEEDMVEFVPRVLITKDAFHLITFDARFKK